MKAMSALAALMLSLAPACGAQASSLGHWCERAVKQRMLAPSAYRRVNLVEAWQPVFFAPWSGLPAGQLVAFVEYDVRSGFGVPLRSAAKCVYGRE
jgi:hypothetical protein